MSSSLPHTDNGAQVQGDAQWTARQLAALRRRAHGLPAEDAYAAHMATATLLASM